MRDVIWPWVLRTQLLSFNPDICKNKHKHNLVKLVQNMNDKRNSFFGLNMYIIVRLSQQHFLIEVYVMV